ncbi:MAG: hypothetical protein ABIQ16_21755 [Polyangiaceae bacterium]
MNTVFARAVLALGLVALPASALASTKTSAKHSHSVAKKDPTSKKDGKRHNHKASGTKAFATAAPTKASVSAKAAPMPKETAPKAP